MTKDILVTYTNGQSMRITATSLVTNEPDFIQICVTGKTIYLNKNNILGVEVKHD